MPAVNRSRIPVAFSLLFALFVLWGDPVTAADLLIEDLAVGNGDLATPGADVTVHYTGWLTDGTKFDSSLDRGEPFVFPLGAGRVIAGWDQGVAGMKVGGKRKLTIPPELGYGPNGAGKVIPPNATLVFEVSLLGVTPPPYTNIGNDELVALRDRGVAIIDIRTKGEWVETGLVPGSKTLTAFDENRRFVPSFPSDLAAIAQPDQEIILICRTGNRSQVIANFLANKMGYTKVYNHADGIEDWKAKGLPTEKCCT
ncbi:MAG: FKBP-type peptidyl-prolyl cis-trans isomerase [Rhodospirillales bacterium]